MIDRTVLEQLSRDLVDQGKLIEAGWVSMRAVCVPLDAPQVQIDEMRNAFMAGAQHLFASIMAIMDPDTEPTEKDMERMSLISDELDRFAAEITARLVTKGNA